MPVKALQYRGRKEQRSKKRRHGLSPIIGLGFRVDELMQQMENLFYWRGSWRRHRTESHLAGWRTILPGHAQWLQRFREMTVQPKKYRQQWRNHRARHTAVSRCWSDDNNGQLTDGDDISVHTQKIFCQTKIIVKSSRELKMEGLAQNKRTANHVKRVSCRANSLTNLTVISLLLVTCSSPAQAGDISCQGIRYTYFNKGLDTSEIPATPQQGKSNSTSVSLTNSHNFRDTLLSRREFLQIVRNILFRFQLVSCRKQSVRNMLLYSLIQG